MYVFFAFLWSVGLAPVFVRSRRWVYVFSAFCGRPVGRGLLRAFGPRLGGKLHQSSKSMESVKKEKYGKQAFSNVPF